LPRHSFSVRSLPCFHQTFHRTNSSSSSNTSFFSPTSFLSRRSKIFSSYNQPSRVQNLLTLSWLLSAYNTTLSSLLDQHAPVITKLSKRKTKSNPWFTTTVRAFRSTVHRAENLWKRTHSAHIGLLSNLFVTNTIDGSSLPKKQYFSNLVSSVSDNPKCLWKTVNNLLHRKSSSPLPTSTPGSSLADSFANFFTGKISKLHISLTSNTSTSSPHSPSPSTEPSSFYRAMHFSAKRGIAIACRLSVCPSVTLVDCCHIGWNCSKIISPLLSLGCSLFATPT